MENILNETYSSKGAISGCIASGSFYLIFLLKWQNRNLSRNSIESSLLLLNIQKAATAQLLKPRRVVLKAKINDGRG